MCSQRLLTRMGFAPKRAESVTKIRIMYEPPAAVTFNATHRPSRAPPNRIFADFGLDFVRAHAGAEIPRLVIGAYMVETEPKIIPETLARFRRAMFSRHVTVRVIAFPEPRATERQRRFEFVCAASHTQKYDPHPVPKQAGGSWIFAFRTLLSGPRRIAAKSPSQYRHRPPMRGTNR